MLNDQLLDQILPLLAKGQKIEAIALLRSKLNLGLAEAKQAIDQLDADRLVSATDASSDSDAWQAAAKELLLQGKKLAAIKLCQEQTGCSLMSAKEKVEALAAKHGLRVSGGCFGMLLFVATTLVTALSGAIYFA